MCRLFYWNGNREQKWITFLFLLSSYLPIFLSSCLFCVASSSSLLNGVTLIFNVLSSQEAGDIVRYGTGLYGTGCSAARMMYSNTRNCSCSLRGIASFIIQLLKTVGSKGSWVRAKRKWGFWNWALELDDKMVRQDNDWISMMYCSYAVQCDLSSEWENILYYWRLHIELLIANLNVAHRPVKCFPFSPLW